MEQKEMNTVAHTQRWLIAIVHSLQDF